jgi:hypothetical protein
MNEKANTQPFADQGRWTAIHNFVFDEIMPVVSGNTFKVLSLIIRRTKGHDQKSAALSYGEIMDGTGIKSEATINKALDELAGIETFGSALILVKRGEENGVTSHRANRYALNRKFVFDSAKVAPTTENHASKNEAYASKNEASINSHASKNEASHASKNEASFYIQEQYKETKSNTWNECESTHAQDFSRSQVTHSQPPPDTQTKLHTHRPILVAMCKICGDRDPDNIRNLLTQKEAKALPALIPFLLKQADGDESKACENIKAYFAPNVWPFQRPPQIWQLQSEYNTQKQIFEKGHDNGTNQPARRDGEYLTSAEKRAASWDRVEQRIKARFSDPCAYVGDRR